MSNLFHDDDMTMGDKLTLLGLALVALPILALGLALFPFVIAPVLIGRMWAKIRGSAH